MDESGAANQLVVYALVGLISLSMLSMAAWLALRGGSESGGEVEVDGWIDPVLEIEDDNHRHNDLLIHRLWTDNLELIDLPLIPI